MISSRLQPNAIARRDIAESLVQGWTLFRQNLWLSMGYAAIFSVIGMLLISATVRIGLAPMTWALAGGFLLVGPTVLIGFFAISSAHRQGRSTGWGDIARGLRRAPRGLVGLSLVCILLFIIWMTDAGILYSFMVGDMGAGWATIAPLTTTLFRFQLGAFTMGAVFALIVFCIAAYSVPLLIERRATLVTGVSASVRAVFMSPVPHLLWALLLAAAVLSSALITPALVVVLPVMAFASEALYRRVFPALPGTD